MKHFFTDSLQCSIKKRCTNKPYISKGGITSNNNCLKLCSEGKELAKCKWVSFNFDLKNCILFATDECEGQVIDIDGTISSQVACYIECPIKEGKCNGVSIIKFLLTIKKTRAIIYKISMNLLHKSLNMRKNSFRSGCVLMQDWVFRLGLESTWAVSAFKLITNRYPLFRINL